jgi:MerR family transcriptional regulator/heat shock protein HspR
MSDRANDKSQPRKGGEQPGERDPLFPDDQGVFMISVAAELAGMHPQTLRIYEARGLVTPTRSPKKTRLYSWRDVERLRRIQELTTEFGLNLAGVERVLALEQVMNTMREQLDQLEQRAKQMEQEMLDRIDEVHRSYRRELVRWQPPEEALRPRDATKSFQIRISKKPNGREHRQPDVNSEKQA